jgi:hypothetical protein
LLGTTILSTQQIFCSSLQIGPTDAILDILGSLRTQDLSTVTCQASSINANTVTVKQNIWRFISCKRDNNTELKSVFDWRTDWFWYNCWWLRIL